MATSWSRLHQCYITTGAKLSKTPRRFFVRCERKWKADFVRCCAGSPSPQKDAFQKIQYILQTPAGQKKDTSSPLPSAYSPPFVEAAWYDWWVHRRFFSLDTQQVASDAEEKFVLLLPPPNVTGTLHLGHALTNSIQDALVRWHRMKGHRTVWVPGCDHAGIATQVVVEKWLWAQQQQTRHQLGRDNFVAQVWKWKESQGAVIEEQMKRLGSSFDWARNFFTLDERLSKAVTEAFVRLHECDKIYRDVRLVNWSCCLRSSVSDIEVDNVAVSGRTRRWVPGYEDPVEFGILSSFAYPVQGSDEEIVVSTTRLETMLGDTAVAVHPEDPRYSHLIGRQVRHPLCERSMPIIADAFVNRGFGSGAVKITPGHDFVDMEVGRRHALPELSILDDEGNMSVAVGQQFQGLKRYMARQKVRDTLMAMNLYHGEVDHNMVLPICSRSGDVVEPRLKEQWFVSCQEMAQRAVQAVQSGQLTFSAPHHEAVWFEWLSNVKDWCISRQLWWGHRIPAYNFQTEGKSVWIAARSEEEAVAKFHHQHPSSRYTHITQDEDVLDTWFSSALLPFSLFGWPQDMTELGKLYPLTLMETGHDILFFWVARMVMLGLQLTDTLPFKHVLLHGIVRDTQGRKMSKSLGNVIDPMDIIQGATLQNLHNKLNSVRLTPAEIERAREEQRNDFPEGIPECGADALRFTLCSYDFQAEEVRLNVLHARTNRLFCNKIWQACRFLQKHLPNHFVPLPVFTLSGCENVVDQWILSRLSEMVSVCDAAFTSHSLHLATTVMHKFWLTDFCGVYLECSKAVLRSGERDQQEAMCQVLYHVTHTFLCSLAPFMPFLAEELFQRLPVKDNWPESICIASYPLPADYPWHDADIERVMCQVQTMCHHILAIRHQYNITKAAIPVHIVVEDEATVCCLEDYRSVLCQLARAHPIHFVTSMAEPLLSGHATAVINSTCQIYVQLQGHIDVSLELERLSRKREKVTRSQEKVKAKLSDLMDKGKSHLSVAHKLQEKEVSLAADLENIRAAINSMQRMQNPR